MILVRLPFLGSSLPIVGDRLEDQSWNIGNYGQKPIYSKEKIHEYLLEDCLFSMLYIDERKSKVAHAPTCRK